MNADLSEQQVVRLSLGWLLLGVLGFLALGIIGGIIGQQIINHPLPPLTGDDKRLVTTIQEITISPTKARQEVLKMVHGSVMLLATEATNTILATGVVLTNDGLLVTTARPPSGPLVALDNAGRKLVLEPLGTDQLYGVSFFRIMQNVVVPIDMRQSDPEIGEELLAITRNSTTFAPMVSAFVVNDYTIPENSLAVQKQGVGYQIGSLRATSLPVIDEQGRLGGLVTNTAQGELLPVTAIRASLERFTSNQLERNLYEELGFTPSYQFNSENGLQFVVEVSQVINSSPADLAGLKRGDRLRKINDISVAFDTNVTKQLSASLPLTLNITRGDSELELMLEANVAPSS